LTLALGWQLLGWAAPASADTVYVVQSGDTLYRISLRFGVSMQSLMTINHLASPSLIYAGQQLMIPEAGATVTPAASPAAAATATVYIVKPGDYVHHIAVQFGVSVEAIVAANGLQNANFLMVGQRLVIPSADFVPAPVSTAAAEATPPPPASAPADATPVPSNSSSSQNIVYVVKAGDTLWGVSRRFGISLATLKSMNQLFNDFVYVGQPLIIPGPDATPVLPPTVEATPPATLPAWIPAISWHARDLYLRSIEHGRNPNAFSVAGDCNSDYAIYLGPIARHVVGLGTGDFFYLNNIVSRFWSSINRPSLAVHGGYNIRSVMDPQWANPLQCKPGERPLDCELRVNNSSIVFIALGTGDQFAWQEFEKNYRWLLQSVLDQNVLPVLVTKADNLEAQQGGATPHFIDDVIRRLGREYDLPVMDLWLGMQDLPNGGLVWEGGQDFHLSNEGSTRHNIMTLQTLEVIARGR
jgi:LysM repeat protein